jgi:hypothetical protein
MKRIYKAIVLNDYEGAPYAEWIRTGQKTIETRHKKFNYTGDLVICCGKTNSVGQNAGKAICIVDLWKVRPMKKTDEAASGVRYDPSVYSFLLRNWRHFSRDFEFAPQRISGAWQSIFTIEIPSDVKIIAKPEIKPFKEI